MKTKTLTKIDVPHCKAEINVVQTFYENNSNKYFTASINYYEKGMRLFSESTKIVRISEKDALNDGIEKAKENNFN